METNEYSNAKSTYNKDSWILIWKSFLQVIRGYESKQNPFEKKLNVQ